MNKIYQEGGNFDFIYNIPQILYSSLISGFINALIQALSMTESNLIKLKQEARKKDAMMKKEKTVKIIKIKLILFFIINFAFIILFWFYLACFCAVYKNTQLYLIKDTLISFGTSMIYPFGLYIFPAMFRINALKGENKDCIYNFSKILQMI